MRNFLIRSLRKNHYFNKTDANLFSALTKTIVYSAQKESIKWFYFISIRNMKWISGNINLLLPIITALIGLFGIMYIQWHSKTREIQESHRAKKIEVYVLLFDIIEEFQKSIKNGKNIDVNDIEIQEKFYKLTRGLILWASSDVINAWLNFRDNSSSESDALSYIKKIDIMYAAIRKDLGHKNNNLEKYSLIKMNLADPEKLNF